MKRILTFIIFCLISLIAMDISELQDKIDIHFASYDKNQNGLLERSEYNEKLKQEDAGNIDEDGQNEEDSYYMELTQLLYEQYDIDSDGNLNLQEWRLFSKDIMDESSPEYLQISKDPRLRQLEL